MERYIERPQENARRKGVIWSGIRKDTVVSRDTMRCSATNAGGGKSHAAIVTIAPQKLAGEISHI